MSNIAVVVWLPTCIPVTLIRPAGDPGTLSMFENLRADIERAKWDRTGTLEQGVWKNASWAHTLRILMAQNTWSVIAYRFAHWAGTIPVPIVRHLILVVAIIFE